MLFADIYFLDLHKSIWLSEKNEDNNESWSLIVAIVIATTVLMGVPLLLL